MIWFIVYNTLLIILRFFLTILSPFVPRLKEAKNLRKGVLQKAYRILQKAQKRPVWILHGASVGELIQVSAIVPHIIQYYKKANGEIPFFVFTFFSLSAKSFGERLRESLHRDSEFSILPWDYYFSVKKWLNILNPAVSITASYDIWPNLILQLSKNRTPCFLISALLSPRSGRFQGITAPFYKKIYSLLKIIDTTDIDIAKRYRNFLNNRVPVYTSGDTRCDYIAGAIKGCEPCEGYDPKGKLSKANETIFRLIKNILKNTKKKYPVFLAASVYKKCDLIILPALEKVLQLCPELKILYVPHHTDEKRIAEISAEMKSVNLRFTRTRDLEGSTPKNRQSDPIILVDKVGLLLNLYSLADFVFIGGSFHKKIHNTFESASLGLAMSFGPLYFNAPEALQFIISGGATVVENQAAFHEWLVRMINDPKVAKKMGAINQTVFQKNLGASKRTVKRILDYLQSQ